jgi:arylsulfatase A-like enzyme
VRKNQGKQFFLYLAFNAVHTPLESPAALTARFKDKPAAGSHRNPTYAGMLASLDNNIGRVLATLDELHLADNTLVIFSSDNGGVGGYQREGINANDITDNAPLKGGKGTLYEGGIRIPYIFRWPGHVKPGTTSDLPINSVDLYPTLLELAGAKPPAGHPLDGTSYLKLLGDADQARPDRPPLFWHFPGYLGAGGNTWRTLPGGVIRDGDWKLIEYFEDNRLELYNLKDDIGEKHNLATANPGKSQELHKKLAQWRQELKAPMPHPKTAADLKQAKGKKGKKQQDPNNEE